MKMMQGALALALRNRSRTRLAPTPTNISTNSEAAIEKNGTPASPAMARAKRVLPVPGGPTSSTPLGILAPTAVKRSGSFKKVTTSCSSSLASPIPATSSNRTATPPSSCNRGLLLPKPMARLATWAERRIRRASPANSNSTNKPLATRPAVAPSARSSRTLRGTFACSAVRKSSWSLLNTGTVAWRPSSKRTRTSRCRNDNSRSLTLPARRSFSNWL